MAYHVGGSERPIVILPDERELNGESISLANKPVYRAWKACYQGLLHGFGFGMALLDLPFGELLSLSRYSELNEDNGDVMVSLKSAQCPLHLETDYRGLGIDSELYIMSPRTKCNTQFESMVVAHQHVFCLVLEHGVREKTYGSDNGRSPSVEDMAFVSNVSCRFGVRIPRAGGMRDFLREVRDSPSVAGVENEGGLLPGKKKRVAEGNKEAWDGWEPNPRTESLNTKCGTFVVYTVLPSLEGDLSEDAAENAGLYLTVTERIVRCFTERQGEEGLFYEYVAALDATETTTVRTMFLALGCSIVLPSTFAVRISGHDTLALQLIGYVVNVERLTGKDYCFFPAQRCGAVKDLFEYNSNAHFLREDREDVEVTKPFSGDSSEPFVIGSLPTLLNVEIDNHFRRKMVEGMYNVLPGASSLGEVYEKNLTVRIDKWGAINDGNVNKDLIQDGEMRFGLSGETQWIMEDEPFYRYERLMGGKLSFPLNLKELREKELRRIEAREREIAEEEAAERNEEIAGCREQPGEKGSNKEHESQKTTEGEGRGEIEYLETEEKTPRSRKGRSRSKKVIYDEESE